MELRDVLFRFIVFFMDSIIIGVRFTYIGKETSFGTATIISKKKKVKLDAAKSTEKN